MFNAADLSTFDFFAKDPPMSVVEQDSTQNNACSKGAGGDDPNANRTNLIVNYIPQLATEGELTEMFSKIGELESVKIMRDHKTGYSYGYGFVKYLKEEDAAQAIHLLNGMSYKNKRLKVSYSRPPGVEMKDSNLYISNLPREFTTEEVQKLFGAYGEIVQTTVLKDKVTGMPRGVAFVRYAKGEQAQAAIAGLNGRMLENALFPLSVRVAEDHGRQKAQYLVAFRGGRGGYPGEYFQRNFFR